MSLVQSIGFPVTTFTKVKVNSAMRQINVTTTVMIVSLPSQVIVNEAFTLMWSV